MVRGLQKFRWAGPGGDDGQALVEYALILMLIALVAIPLLTTIGADLTAKFSDVTDAF